MEKIKARLKRLFLQTGLLLMLYTLCRLLFIFANRSVLDIHSFAAAWAVIVTGFRFDLSAIAFTNALFISLVLLPAPIVNHTWYRKMVMLSFIIINSFCLLVNLIDIAYFPFVHKRSQADALLYVTGKKGNDLLRLLPSFLLQYWYLLLVFCGLVFLLWKAYRYTATPVQLIPPAVRHYLVATSAYLVVLGITVIAIRGGWQEQPLDIIHATATDNIKNVPAILNTPFSIIKTWKKKGLNDRAYFPEKELIVFNQGIHTSAAGQLFAKKNVVIIVVESLSRKFLGYFGGKAKTPFLDSVFSEGLVFTNAFANAYESVQGIPAIISAIPSWQSDPFLFSPYVSDKITSLPALLQAEGYQTSFFHGGYNGTMGFDSYAGMAGISHYYGMNEFNNKKEYDGYWGIWDEPFLQYTAKQLAGMPNPFFATIFTLNTHHPFLVPPQYRQVYNKHQQPFLNCVEYADFALARFFETIKDQPWYKNTLFVITADHTALNMEGEHNTTVDYFRIPLCFFSPMDSTLKDTRNEVASQIDILPSVLDILHYPYPYFSFGKSLFSPADKRFTISYSQQIFQYVDSAFCYQFNGESPLAFYDLRSDSGLKNNLYAGAMNRDILRCDSNLKQMIQFFNHCMVQNKMHLETISGK